MFASISYKFNILAFIFGVIYIFIVPPFQAPDEVHHYFRAYHIAQGHTFGEKNIEKNRFGGYLPQSLMKIAQPFRPLRYHPERKITKDSILNVSKYPLNPTNTVFLDFPNVAYYAPMGYLPATLGPIFGYSFNLNPLATLYLCRFLNFIGWLLLVFWAIKKMPFHQNTLAYLALLPASLCFHAGLNPDAITNGLSFLLLAYLLNLAYSDAILKKTHLWLLIVSLIITLNKVVYAPIFLLAWLIPTTKFPSKKAYWLLNIGLLLIHLIVILGWYRLAGDQFIPYDAYHPDFREDKQLNPGIAPIAQLQFIWNHPYQFLQILYNSYVETFPWTLKHYVGKFGWEGNYVPKWLNDLLLWSILLFSLTDFSKIKTDKKYYFLLIATGFILTMAFSVVIYMQWSPPGHDFIRSLSGRYFIPIFPLFILALKSPIKVIPSLLHQWFLVFLILLANAITINEVLHRYFY